MNIGLILAGGSATRMKQDIPKQFLNVHDKPIIVYVLEAYERHPEIDELYVVCIEGWERMVEAYARQFNISKLKGIVRGGKTGQESITNGVNALLSDHSKDDMVLVQDSNRPMVSAELISNGLRIARECGSAVTCQGFTDYVPFVVADDHSSAHIDRDRLFGSQTPQIYPLGKLAWAFEEARKRGESMSTASCVHIMHELGEKLYVNLSDHKNIKITTVEDIEVFKALLTIKRDDWIK